MLFTVWVVFHVITCVALVLVVLMQSAKGEGLAGSAFGGGGGGGMGNAVFGGRGAASFLGHATTVLAIVFMVNCIGLAFISSSSRVGADFTADGPSSVTSRAQQEYEQSQAARQQQVNDSIARATGDSGVSLQNLIQTTQPANEGETTPADSN